MKRTTYARLLKPGDKFRDNQDRPGVSWTVRRVDLDETRYAVKVFVEGERMGYTYTRWDRVTLV